MRIHLKLGSVEKDSEGALKFSPMYFAKPPAILRLSRSNRRGATVEWFWRESWAVQEATYRSAATMEEADREYHQHEANESLKRS